MQGVGEHFFPLPFLFNGLVYSKISSSQSPKLFAVVDRFDCLAVSFPPERDPGYIATHVLQCIPLIRSTVGCMADSLVVPTKVSVQVLQD